MKKFQPMSVTVFPWLRINLGDSFYLTATDRRALRAAIEIIDLFAHIRSPGLIEAFGTIVKQMHPSSQELAYHAIAHSMDWQHRAQVWAVAGLPALPNPRLCKCEPRANA
jgi:hypothetical protein